MVKYFDCEDHEKRYNAFLKKWPSAATSDRVALYILSSSSFQGRNIAKYIDFDNKDIDFYTALEEDTRPGIWSANESTLIELGAALFNGLWWEAQVNKIFGNLKESSLLVGLEAVRVRFS